jgi:hypothetical protein
LTQAVALGEERPIRRATQTQREEREATGEAMPTPAAMGRSVAVAATAMCIAVAAAIARRQVIPVIGRDLGRVEQTIAHENALGTSVDFVRNRGSPEVDTRQTTAH